MPYRFRREAIAPAPTPLAFATDEPRSSGTAPARLSLRLVYAEAERSAVDTTARRPMQEPRLAAPPLSLHAGRSYPRELSARYCFGQKGGASERSAGRVKSARSVDKEKCRRVRLQVLGGRHRTRDCRSPGVQRQPQSQPLLVPDGAVERRDLFKLCQDLNLLPVLARHLDNRRAAIRPMPPNHSSSIYLGYHVHGSARRRPLHDHSLPERRSPN